MVESQLSQFYIFYSAKVISKVLKWTLKTDNKTHDQLTYVRPLISVKVKTI